MRISVITAAVLGVALLVGFVVRTSPASTVVADDGTVPEARAELIAQTCAACHGTGGRLQTTIPSLAGQPEAVMVAQLLAFRRDEMPDATVMPRLAKGYTDEELKAVARYFATLETE